VLDGGRGDDRSRIPGAELVVFEHSGHMAFAEEPEAYRDAVRRFLAPL
jgi:pimeloyl-ACP methyl ester carboxylesterase